MWFDGASLDVKFIRLFELAENKLAIVVGKHFTVNGEAWKWRRRLFVWKEELVRECVDQLIRVVLHVEVAYRWV